MKQKSDKKSIFTSKALLRILLLLAASCITLLVVPRADVKSFSYELNQPWKYPLLTADFDIPIMRDSASQRAMRDSIEANYAPFVKQNTELAAANVTRFRNSISGLIGAKEAAILVHALADAYADGIVPTELYQSIHTGNNTKVRHFNGNSGDGNTGIADPTVTTSDAAGYLSPKLAYNYVDSLFSVSSGAQRNSLPADVAKALTLCITPDINVDSAVNDKFRDQEYLGVTGALGVIKKGQRIVDRGEIVTAQIYTNLDTYQEMRLRQQSDENNRIWFVIGQAVYILICFTMLYLFLNIYRSRFFADMRKMTFLMTFITLFVVLATLMFEYVPLGIYLVPFAAVPVIIMVFFDSRTAILSLLTTILLSTLVATFQFQFIFIELTAGLCATFSIHQLSRRSQLLRTGGITFLAYIISFGAIALLSKGSLEDFSLRQLLMFFFNSVILSFAYILILVIEKCFGFISTVTLVELSDINNPLLRRLAEEAPGTFQHSIQVSTLASEAARAVGANTQLVRTGALYHDIGKMESPVFFTENQHGVNPHAGLDPETSAQKIIRHVTDGLALASKAKLPSIVKSFIAEHHGRGVAKYFYNTAVNESNGKPVDRSRFMYPGPNPQSKETAILMMADAVEAASRSLRDHSPQDIDALVDKIIDSQIADGMYRDSPVSFKDIEIIKQTFKKRLATIYHSRIAYPELHNPAQETPGDTTKE